MSTTITVLPQGTYAVGAHPFSAQAVPVGVSYLALSLDATQMTDPALSVRLEFDLSLDGGVTWATTNRGPQYDPFPLSVVFAGGLHTDRQGHPITADTLQVPLQQSQSSARQIRGTMTVIGVPLTSVATLTIS